MISVTLPVYSERTSTKTGCSRAQARCEGDSSQAIGFCCPNHADPVWRSCKKQLELSFTAHAFRESLTQNGPYYTTLHRQSEGSNVWAVGGFTGRWAV